MDFDNILLNTLQLEGGYTEADGYPTNYGVRQDIYNAYTKENKLESKNVRDLTFGEVKNFYKDAYWDNPKISSLPSEKVSALVFDYGVNAGQGTAIKKLQEVIGTKADGIIGKKTRNAITKYIEKNGEENLVNELLLNRENHYTNLAISNPIKYGKNLQGWNNRISRLRELYTSNQS